MGSAAAAFVARTNRGESGRYKTLINTHAAVLRVTVHPNPPSLKLEKSSRERPGNFPNSTVESGCWGVVQRAGQTVVLQGAKPTHDMAPFCEWTAVECGPRPARSSVRPLMIGGRACR